LQIWFLSEHQRPGYLRFEGKVLLKFDLEASLMGISAYLSGNRTQSARQTALDVNIPNYASAIVSTNEIVEARVQCLDNQANRLISAPRIAVAFLQSQYSNGQYVAKKNSTRRIRDSKEWERTGKALKSLGGCNFRKGKHLAFGR
jgi:hypothetical protein